MNFPKEDSILVVSDIMGSEANDIFENSNVSIINYKISKKKLEKIKVGSFSSANRTSINKITKDEKLKSSIIVLHPFSFSSSTSNNNKNSSSIEDLEFQSQVLNHISIGNIKKNE